VRPAAAAIPTDPHARDRLRAVEEHLRKHPAESVSLADLAAQADMSRFHFLRAFKREFGLTPHAYQLQLRVEAAAALLRATDMSCTAIAYEVGFSSASGLSTSFAKRYGQSPDRWRNQGLVA
jgi:AraC family transcriptional regulator